MQTRAIVALFGLTGWLVGCGALEPTGEVGQANIITADADIITPDAEDPITCEAPGGNDTPHICPRTVTHVVDQSVDCQGFTWVCVTDCQCSFSAIEPGRSCNTCDGTAHTCSGKSGTASREYADDTYSSCILFTASLVCRWFLWPEQEARCKAFCAANADNQLRIPCTPGGG